MELETRLENGKNSKKYSNKNSTKLGLIISSKIARKLQLRVDKSNPPKVCLASEGQQLKILGQLPDLELHTRLESDKIFQCTSPALVCDNLDDDIIIRLTF